MSDAPSRPSRQPSSRNLLRQVLPLALVLSAGACADREASSDASLSELAGSLGGRAGVGAGGSEDRGDGPAHAAGRAGRGGVTAGGAESGSGGIAGGAESGSGGIAGAVGEGGGAGIAGASGSGGMAGAAGNSGDDGPQGGTGGAAGASTMACHVQPMSCSACDGVTCTAGEVVDFQCHSSGPIARRCTCLDGAFACEFNCLPGPPVAFSGTGFTALSGYAVEGRLWSKHLFCDVSLVVEDTVAPDGTFVLAWPNTPMLGGIAELTFSKEGAPTAKCTPKGLEKNATTPISPENCPLVFAGTMP